MKVYGKSSSHFASKGDKMKREKEYQEQLKLIARFHHKIFGPPLHRLRRKAGEEDV